MSTTGPVYRRGNKKPQVIWSADHKLRTMGRQIESSAGIDSGLGPIVTPMMSIREAVGMLGGVGGRLFFTEGVWVFDEAITIDIPDIHFLSTSPGKTIFKRPSTSTSTASIITLSGDGAILDGIRFIDKVSGASAVVSCTSTRPAIKNCVFEDVQKGINVSGTWASIRDCSFLTSQGYAIEFSGTASNGIITGNLIQDTGGSVYLGDNVSKVSVINNVFQNTGGGSVMVSYAVDQGILTGSALNVVHSDQVQERSPEGMGGG